MDIITYESVKQKIIEIRNQKVIIDSDIAELMALRLNVLMKQLAEI
jgi:hypothetical protein